MTPSFLPCQLLSFHGIVCFVLNHERKSLASEPESEAAKAAEVEGRYAQVKAAVRSSEHRLFYHDLAKVDGRHLSDIIRDSLIELAIHYRLIPEDYE